MRGKSSPWRRTRQGRPELAGLWCRDLRKVAKTLIVDAGAPTETTKAILGHRGDVADGYYRARFDAMQRALEALTLVPEPTVAVVPGREGAARAG